MNTETKKPVLERPPAREPMIRIRYDGPPDVKLEEALRACLDGFAYKETSALFDRHHQANYLIYTGYTLRRCDDPSVILWPRPESNAPVTAETDVKGAE